MIKIKTTLIISSIFFVFSSAYAQKEVDSFKPSQGSTGIVFNVSGIVSNINLSPSADPFGNNLLLGRHYLRDQHVIRVGLGITSSNDKVSLIDSVGSLQRTLDSTYKKFNFYLTPGYEFHFLEGKRLDPYIGGSLNFGLLGKTKYTTTEDLTDTTGTNNTEISYQKEGGFLFGANAIVGFNYFVVPNLAIGAEYALGFYSVRDGGDWEKVTVINPVSGNSTSKREVGTERTALSGFNTSNKVSITLSYYFGQGKKD
ncbi:MAG: hypothetical protein KDC83_06765 [Flavobacteriales bacterium]|nr:hypothetical protein [Flavobacteriales bacterium]